MKTDIIAFIGNGFDLSLGLKTSYGNFISEKWDSFNSFPDLGLKGFLSKKAKDCLWFDLEKAISDYVYNIASQKSEVNPEIEAADIKFYEALVDALGQYLRNIQNKTLHIGNFMAEEIMKAIENKTIDSVFTFNYTDITTLAEKRNIKINKESINHLHGDTYNPILGIIDFTDESIKIPRPYCKWIKSWNINYTPHIVSERLMKAKEVIFYGLSFGAIDYIYFKDYFNYISNFGLSDSPRVEIDIITKDYESQIDIFTQLREMGIDINTLMARCNLNIIRLGKGGELDSRSFRNYENLKERLLPELYDEYDQLIR